MARRQLPGGRHGLSPERVADHQRQRIMDAVVQLSAERGARALTVQHLLSHAGISRKTFYDHFPNREAAVVATYQLVTGQVAAAIAATANADEHRRDPLASGLTALLALVRSRPDVARFCFVEAPLAATETAPVREAFVAALIRWLRDAGGRGDIRLRAAAGGLLEALAAGPGDGRELLAFLQDATRAGR
jgi:AcrR family transcriptional regulator